MARRLKTYKAPANEAADLADKAKALKKDGEAISGDLTEDAVKELLTFGGRRPNAAVAFERDAGAVRIPRCGKGGARSSHGRTACWIPLRRTEPYH